MTAMLSNEATAQIAVMLNSFPDWARSTDDERRMRVVAYEQSCSGFSSEAVIQASRRFTAGNVNGQRKDRAPTVAEFCDECRKREEYIALKRGPRPALLPPAGRSDGKMRLDEDRAEVMEKYAGWGVYNGLSLDGFRLACKLHQFPTGTVWTHFATFVPPAKIDEVTYVQQA